MGRAGGREPPHAGAAVSPRRAELRRMAGALARRRGAGTVVRRRLSVGLCGSGRLQQPERGFPPWCGAASARRRGVWRCAQRSRHRPDGPSPGEPGRSVPVRPAIRFAQTSSTHYRSPAPVRRAAVCPDENKSRARWKRTGVRGGRQLPAAAPRGSALRSSSRPARSGSASRSRGRGPRHAELNVVARRSVRFRDPDHSIRRTRAAGVFRPCIP